MNHPLMNIPADVNSDSHKVEHFQLGGPWLSLIRVAWLLLSLSAVALWSTAGIWNTLGWWNCGNHIHCWIDNREELQFFGSFHVTAIYYGLNMVLRTLPWILVGILIFWRKSHDLFALLLSLGILLFGTMSDGVVTDVVSHQFQILSPLLPILGFLTGALLVVWYYFPNGQLAHRHLLWLAIPWLALEFFSNFFPQSSLNYHNWTSPLPDLVLIFIFFSIGFFLIYRHIHTKDRIERQQIRWVVFTGAILLCLVVPLSYIGNWLFIEPRQSFLYHIISRPIIYVALALFPVGIGISILKYQLWEIDVIISRALVYGALTASIVGIYILTVGGVGILFQRQNNLTSIVLTILVTFLLFQPLRQRLQKLVNHLVPVPKAIIQESIPQSMTQTKQDQQPPTTGGVSNTILRGRWLTLAQLAWGIAFITLTAMYASGFLEVRKVLSTVCEEGPCTLNQQIRHTEAADKIMKYAGPPIGFADPLRPDQVRVLKTLDLTLDQYGWLAALQMGIPALVYLLISAWLFWRKPNDWMVLFVSTMIMMYPFVDMPLPFTLVVHRPAWEWIAALANFVAVSFWFIWPLVFPTGRFVPRWTRWKLFLDIPFAAMQTLWTISIFTEPPTWDGFVYAYVVLSFSINAYALSYRYFRVASPVERQQIKWVVVGLVEFVVIGILLDTMHTFRPLIIDSARTLALSAIPITVFRACTLFLPVAIAISVLRYRLWDIDVIISRTLVYGTLTAGIVILYILMVSLLGTLLKDHVSLAAALVTMAATVPLFQPSRLRVQRAVNRVTLGGSGMTHTEPESSISAGELEIPSYSYRLAWLIFTLTCILCALSLVLLVLSWTTPVTNIYGFRGQAAILALSFGSIGLLLVRHRWQNPIGLLLLAAGFVNAIVEVSIEYAAYSVLTKPDVLPYGPFAGWVASWLWFIAIAMLIYSFLLFPNGHLPSARWKPAAWFIVGAFALTTLTFMSQPGPLYFAPYLDNPFAVPSVYRLLSPFQAAGTGAILLIGISILLRLRSAYGVERQQLKWFAYTATLITLIGISDSAAAASGLGKDPKFLQNLTVAIWIAIPCAIAFSILRYRLWDIDIIISRTLVYGTLSAAIVTVYVVLVGTLSLFSQTASNLPISLIATGLVAFLFQPLRERLQGSVNRLLYGDRDDPYAALSRLGRRLEASLGPETVLPTIVTTVREALKLPYTAIYLKQDEDYQIIAESASPALRLENGRIRVPGMEREGQCIPLIYQGETLGCLVLGPRTPSDAFTSSDLRLVNDLTPQVGVAVHAMRLTSDLQRSREQLVLAREEERRRLRRDLHDGLGPNLASQGLKLAAVKQLLENNPAAISLLDQVMEQNKSTVGDVRRLVYGLRPPALDELGLVAAIRDHVAGMDGMSTLHVEITEPGGGLPVLSAAVEVAAYRIVLEALTNVIRHAEAKNCAIRFSIIPNGSGDVLALEIQDDGRGMPADLHAGVGLRSMRERAEEIGGTCVIESDARHGTCVVVKVPLIMI